MYKLQYFNREKLVEQFEYSTLEDAQDSIDDNDVSNCTKYKILDGEGNMLEEDEFLEIKNRKMMFDEEESDLEFYFDDFFIYD
ncbi:hypothetical protein NF867_14660 [Solitalea sp. MAHUQ-68]|uniref:Uncharacterized protein n=1 Tax=Solitalea agri TaxID=2953739 RepID=A0A9X2F3N1_9SPHI|nr:hypothetical protein [Solitalea agri]MCO4294102.1 hypothetical protein [Solitalea agri]